MRFEPMEFCFLFAGEFGRLLLDFLERRREAKRANSNRKGTADSQVLASHLLPDSPNADSKTRALETQVTTVPCAATTAAPGCRVKFRGGNAHQRRIQRRKEARTSYQEPRQLR